MWVLMGILVMLSMRKMLSLAAESSVISCLYQAHAMPCYSLLVAVASAILQGGEQPTA